MYTYRILLHELITGHAQDFEVVGMPVGFELLVELFKPFKLRSEPAFGGCVHNEDDFALEVGEGVGFAFLCRRKEISQR